MAAPDYVPRPATERPRVYTSPPWRPDEWTADRPADLTGAQPTGPGLAWQGPDQGYVLTLVHLFDDRLRLTDGERRGDVDAGCVAVALKRASMFGRAPMVHDLTAGYTVWGFLSDAPPDLVALRRPLFEGVAHEHHHAARMRLAELVPDDVLRQPHGALASQAATDWQSLVDVESAAAAASAGH